MWRLNLSSCSIAIISTLLWLSLSEVPVAQEISSPQAQQDVDATAQDETETANKGFIQGYACYSSPTSERIPTTYAIVPKEDGQPEYIPIIRWTSNAFVGYTPQSRCKTVSERLDRYLKLGILEFLIEGKLSKQNVLFAASELLASSSNDLLLTPVQPQSDNLVITLEPSDDPETFLRAFSEVLKAQRSPISRGSRWVRIPKEIESDVLTETPFEVQEDLEQSP